MPHYDSSTLKKLRRSLTDWYSQQARDLPWRRTGDPYRIWISEVMLQQTTVVTVVPFFDRFIARFPTVADLAAADQDEVLRHWEGLGYYSRARNIHQAARDIVAKHQSVFPNTVAGLLELPGIGRYTAGAIVSFAFNRPAPIVEANTLRLYCRLLGYEDNPRSTAGQRVLWSFADELVSESQPGTFNQALMELGALLCTPTNPQCDRCPIRFACQAAIKNRQAEIPKPAVRPQVTHLIEFSVAVRCGTRFLLRKNSSGERWAGLWDFVRFADETAASVLSETEVTAGENLPNALSRRIAQVTRERTGLTSEPSTLLTEITHSVTRYRIRLQCLLAETAKTTPESPDTRWLEPAEWADLPLSVTGRKFACLLERLE